LEDPTNIHHNARGRPYHAIYREPAFPGVVCLEHGYDASSWARRCARFRKLLSNSDAQRLGLHIDYERSPSSQSTSDPANLSVGSDAANCRLQLLVNQSVELMRMADSINISSFHLVAILMVFPQSCSAGLEEVMIPSAEQGDHVCELSNACSMRLEALDENFPGGIQNGRCFARVRPHPRATVLRYVVPHAIKNGKGYPLLGNCSAMLPHDALRFRAMLCHLFPDFFEEVSGPASHK